MAARRRRQRRRSRHRRRDFCRPTCRRETTASRSRISSVRSVFSRSSRSRRATSVKTRQFTIGSTAQQASGRDIDDYQIERLRFFFTIDPALLGGGRAFPNIDILNHSQLAALRGALPDTLRPTLVRIYRLQFGTQPQNPGGPRFRVRGGQTNGTAVYDLLREGVDYVIDRSLLWFALVRPLNESNERLVVAYNVRINGRDTVWTTTGGTPDLQFVPGRDQVANLVMDPTVGPTSAAFRNEIRSVYRIAGGNLARETAKIRIVTGSGRLEHPIAGSDATFLQMFGLAQSANPAEFDAENRLWPRRSDAIFNLGAGAADIRNGQSLDVAYAIHDYFLVFPSLHPFSARDSGLVVRGNPTNDDIYTIPGEYIYSPQHPASLYRMNVRYETVSTEQGGAITIGAGSIRPGSEQVVMDGRQLVRDLDYRVDYDLGRIEFMRPDTVLVAQRHVDVRYEENVSFGSAPTTLAGFMSELPVSHGTTRFSGDQPVTEHVVQPPRPRAAGQLHAHDRRDRAVQLGPAGAHHSRQPAAVRRIQGPVAFFIQRRDRAQQSAVPRAQPGHRVHRDVRRERRHLDRARRPGVVEQQPSGVRQLARIPIRRSVLRAVTRGDARLADERSESDRTPARRESQRDRSAAHVRRQRDRAQRAGAVAHAPAARPGRPLRRRDAKLQMDRQQPRCRGLAPVSQHSNGAQLDRSGSHARRVSAVLDAARHVGDRARVEVGSDGDLGLRRHLRERRAIFAGHTQGFRKRHDVQWEATRWVRQPDSGDRARSVFAILQRRDQRHRASGRLRRHHRRRRRVRSASRDERSRLPRRPRRARRHRRSAHKLHGGQQQARRRRHRHGQRAQLLERAARERADPAIRRRPERAERRHSRRRALHRHAVRSRPAAGADAQLGSRARAVQDADRLAQRRQSAQGARASAHARVGAGTGRRGAGPIADRRVAGRRRAVARPEQSDARRDRGHSSARRVRHHVLDRHDRLERIGRVPTASGHRERGRAKGSAVSGHAHHDQRELAPHPNGEPASLSPRRGVFPFSRGSPVLHGVPAAQRVGPRPRERLGAERRASDVLQGRA